MNIIFLDFDGVLDTIHYHSDEDIERRVAILADICHEYDCKVVIEASAKEAIDEETLEVTGKFVNFIFNLFDKYDIECVGRTPSVIKRLSSSSYVSMWKEDEIRLYLFRHPEVEHYCVIDDDDLFPHNSDLNKVRDHLLTTIYYSDNPEEEGLLLKHKGEIGRILQKENEIRKLSLKRSTQEKVKRI